MLDDDHMERWQQNVFLDMTIYLYTVYASTPAEYVHKCLGDESNIPSKFSYIRFYEMVTKEEKRK